MATGIRQRLPARSFLLLARSPLCSPPRVAAAQAGTITGRVTDQTTGAPLEAARVVLTGTTRIETTNRDGRYTLPRRGARDLPGPRAPGRLPAGDADRHRGRRRDGHARLRAWTPAPVQLDEIVTTATGEQRKLEIGQRGLHHRRGQDGRAGADHRVRQPDLGPRGRASRCSRAAARPAPAPASASVAPTASRSPTSRCTTSTASGSRAARLDARSTSAASVRRSGEPGPSRINDLNPDDIESHRDREGAGRGHALRHPGLERGGPDHHQARHARARRAGTSSARWARCSDNNTYPLNYNGRDTTAATDPDFDGFCILQVELDGALHPDVGADEYSPLKNKATRPLKTGLRQQYGANVSGGSDQVTYFLSAQLRERGRGRSACRKFEEDSIREPARHRCPTTRSGPTRSRD